MANIEDYRDKTKIFVGKRRSGKTNKLMDMAMKTDDKILFVVSTLHQKHTLKGMYENQLENVSFITFHDFMNGTYRYEYEYEKIFIDDVNEFLHHIVEGNTPIEALSINGDCKKLERDWVD